MELVTRRDTHPYMVESAQWERAINNSFKVSAYQPLHCYGCSNSRGHPPLPSRLSGPAPSAGHAPSPHQPQAHRWLSVVHGSSGCRGSSSSSTLLHGRRGVGVVWLLVGGGGPLDSRALDAGSNRLAKELLHLLTKIGKCLAEEERWWGGGGEWGRVMEGEGGREEGW